jgi:hypothetical protein
LLTHQSPTNSMRIILPGRRGGIQWVIQLCGLHRAHLNKSVNLHWLMSRRDAIDAQNASTPSRANCA